MRKPLLSIVSAFLFLAFMGCQTTKTITDDAAKVNTLSKAEKAAGWKLLFDGKSMEHWKGWKKDAPDSKWSIIDDALVFNPEATGNGGDIITKAEFEDYEFSLQWKISECGNSGIIFGIIEDDKYVYPWMTGPEMQVLDDTCHPDGKIVTHRAGDLYDMIETKPNAFKGANVWHTVVIKSKGGAMEFWLNDIKVVEFTMHTPSWDAMVAKSKFASLPDFGIARAGHIGLQDHRDYVSYRNIKIRTL